MTVPTYQRCTNAKNPRWYSLTPFIHYGFFNLYQRTNANSNIMKKDEKDGKDGKEKCIFFHFSRFALVRWYRCGLLQQKQVVRGVPTAFFYVGTRWYVGTAEKRAFCTLYLSLRSGKAYR